MSVSEAESKMIDKNDNFQIGNAQSSIAAASTTHSGSTASEINTEANTMGATVNAIISILEYHRLTLDN